MLDASTCLAYVCQVLQIENLEISVVQSCLQSLGVILHEYDCDSSGNMYIIWLFSIFPALSQNPKLRSPVYRAIEKLSKWLSSNNHQLLPVLEILVNGLNDAENSIDASKSLMSICNHCSNMESFPAVEIHAQLVKLRSQPGFNFKADLNAIDGLGSIVSAQPFEVACRMLQDFISPVAQSLSSNMSAGSKCSKADLVRDLDRITATFRSFSIKVPSDSTGIANPILSLFVQLWPLLQQLILTLQSWEIDEKVCRLYKHVIRKAKRDFSSHIGHMCSHIAETFQARQSSSFIYLASVLISDFSEDPDHHSNLQTLFGLILSVFLSKFTSIDIYVDFPDVVEEFFFCVSRVITSCPAILFGDTKENWLYHIVQSGILGLTISHKDAQKGILKFFHDLTSIGDPSSSIRNSRSSKIKLQVALITSISDFIPQYLPALLNELFLNISGRLPDFALVIDEVYSDSASISQVVWDALQVSKALQSQPFEVYSDIIVMI
jgi:hypothetical protein